MVSPHGMDPKTVLRFVKTVGRLAGQGRGRRLRAGRASRRWGSSSRPRSPARSSAPPTLVLETVAELQHRRRLRGAAERMHELSISSAIVDTALRHADGRRVTSVARPGRRPAPGRARVARVLLRDRRPRHRSARAPGSSSRWSAPGCAARTAAASGTPHPSRNRRLNGGHLGSASEAGHGLTRAACRRSAARAASAPGPRWSAATSSRSSRSRSTNGGRKGGGRCTAPR